jgi:hypothetical protein
MPASIDGFVKNPISALRFIPLSLRRTKSTPHSTGSFAIANITLPALKCFCLFGRWRKSKPPARRVVVSARLELGLFTKPSVMTTFLKPMPGQNMCLGGILTARYCSPMRIL